MSPWSDTGLTDGVLFAILSTCAMAGILDYWRAGDLEHAMLVGGLLLAAVAALLLAGWLVGGLLRLFFRLGSGR